MDMQNAYFFDLSGTELDQQVIIFENKEPSYELPHEVTHVKFSGRSNVGRKGFIANQYGV